MKTILITGASAGIGAATAIEAARNGYDVGVGYGSDQRGAEATCEMVRRLGRKAVPLRADLSDTGQIAAMFEVFASEFGRMSTFVNNAGIVMPRSNFEDISPERLARIVAVNFTGAFIAAQHAVRVMSKRHGGRGGSIVNVSSVAARKGGAMEYVDYAATKGAIETMTVGMATELARQGVRVNAVRPGIIDTDIHAKGGQPDRVAIMAPTIPMKRAGTALEVAQAIIWLASDAASYTTGTILDVSGGR